MSLSNFTFVFLLYLTSPLKGGKVKDGWTKGGPTEPYAVSIQFRPFTGVYKHFCTGSLIRRQWVLTTASCFDNIEDSMALFAILGARKTSQYRGRAQFIPIAQKIIHPDYIRGLLQNDIALLELKTKAQLTNHVQPISLARKSISVEGLEALAYGWGGRVGPHRKTTNKALSVEVSIFPRNSCLNFFQTLPQNVYCFGQHFYNAPCGGTHGIPLTIWDIGNRQKKIEKDYVTVDFKWNTLYGVRYLMVRGFQAMQQKEKEILKPASDNVGYIYSVVKHDETSLAYLVGMASYWPGSCEGPALMTSILPYRDFIKEHVRQSDDEN